MGKVNPEVIRVLKQFKSKTSRKYNVKKMILFGSQAVGEAKIDSDIDLIVVTGRRNKTIVEKLIDEWHVKQKIDYPVDFLDYTESEFKKLSQRISLVKHALETGIEI